MGSKSQQQVQATPSATAAILVVMYIAAFVAAFNENIINVDAQAVVFRMRMYGRRRSPVSDRSVV